MNYWHGLSIGISLLLLSSCTNGDARKKEGASPEATFFDFKIWGEEDKDSVTVLVQFRSRGAASETVELEAGSHVQLDGGELKAGSTRMTGPYYEVRKSMAAFMGQHTIMVSGADKKQYAETFSFTPFTLTAEPATTFNRDSLSLQVDGLPGLIPVHLLITDTAFATNDINEIDTVSDGQLIISPQKLGNLAAGPVTVQIVRMEERPVKGGSKKGGHISVSYGLQRELLLKQ